MFFEDPGKNSLSSIETSHLLQHTIVVFSLNFENSYFIKNSGSSEKVLYRLLLNAPVFETKNSITSLCELVRFTELCRQ